MGATTSFAAVTVSGNGTGSHNNVWTSSFALSSTKQTNVADLTNNVKIGKSWFSKGNSANNNTGSSVTVGSGDTTNTVDVNNLANKNLSTNSNSCCPCSTPTDVTISDNGDHSQNSVWTSTKCITKVDQTNVANVTNNIEVGSSTGGNEASHNTNSDVTVMSGDSTSSVAVNNVVNSNTSN